MTIKYNLLIAATLFASTSAMAGEFSLGAGAVFNESPYKGYNENTTAVPLIREGANKRGNSSRLTQSFHFFMFEP
ncbi:hypothetical protein M8U72_16635, partial [Enterobacter roggenkampii]|nr:hypothetical protein [Enterobacter roggenkampii]